MENNKDKQFFFDKIENFFRVKRRGIFVFSFLLTIVFSLLLFDMRVSIAGDDSVYIQAAEEFMRGVGFPSWHGSFYPIFLSFFMRIFGLNLLIFKLLSFIFILSHLLIFYFTFRQRVSWSVLLLTILYLSVFLELLSFGTQTYSEALFLLLQISVFFSFFRLYNTFSEIDGNFFKEFKQWLMFGLSLFLLAITRNIGWVMLFAAIFYFIIIKQYKNSLKTFLYFFIFYFPFFIYKIIFWGSKKIGFESQMGKMFWIDPYDKNAGMETLGGFVHRFFINSEQYLSEHLFNLFSWTNAHNVNIFLTIVVYIVLAFIGFVIIKKKKELVFPYIYLIFGLFATFISQQIMWNQYRLVLIFVPLFVILLAESLWIFADEKKYKFFKYLSIIFLFLLIIPSSIKTVKAVKKHYPILKANIRGDKYAGYSCQWQNYLKMTQWVAQNIPSKAVVACRKPGMAFIFGHGRNFAGIYSVPTLQVDKLLEKLQKEVTTYHFFVNYQAEGEKFFSLYPYFFYISYILNNADGRQFICFSLEGNIAKEFYSQASKAGIQLYSIDQIKSVFSVKNYNNYAVRPDVLLNVLRKKNISYLIIGHLSFLPNKNTSQFITTIYRYVYFIELKYPGIFNIVWKIGDKKAENAMLLKIDYQKAKILPIHFK